MDSKQQIVEINRSYTSSPIKENENMNQLNIRVNASPIDKVTDQMTPNKKADESIESPLNENKNGLLTYSTPIYLQSANRLAFNQQITPSSSENVAKYLLNQRLSSIKKPRVNFHSIDDIVYGGSKCTTEESHNDSGIASLTASKLSSESSPMIYSRNEEKNEESFGEEENDENKKPNESNNNNNNKKVRTTFTDDQKKSLDIYFQKNPYPDPKETEDLSHQLGLPENVIKVWFQNKRSRDKQRKFSKSRHLQATKNALNDSNFIINSPFVTNLQLLSSRFNSYTAAAALAAAAAASSSQNYYSQNFY